MSLLHDLLRSGVHQIRHFKPINFARSISTSPITRQGQFGDLPNLLAEASQLAPPPTPVKESVIPRSVYRTERARVKVLDYKTKFVKPRDFARDTQALRPRRRPYLGPTAAESKKRDTFYQLGLDPLNEATNSTLLSYFVSEMGKIRSRAQTGLTWKNQRRLGKAIRRAKMMGIIPILSRRPLQSYY